jgi:recombination protein RecA
LCRLSSGSAYIKGRIHVGDKLIEEKIGRKIRWELQFSKTSPGFQSGEYDFYFRGDNVGIDSIGDLADTAESLGLVNRTGAWYQIEDGTKVQGRDGFIARIKEDLNLQQSLKDKLNNV